MFDVNDDAKGGFRRSEILTGPGRRRKWSAEEMGRIVKAGRMTEEYRMPNEHVGDCPCHVVTPAGDGPWPG